MIKFVAAALTGLSSGIAVGIGFVAFLTVLGVIPRLTQLTKTDEKIHLYEGSVICGVVVAGWSDLNNYSAGLSPLILLPIGAASGLFIGMLAAALTEVLNVLPVMARRIGLKTKLTILLMAIVLGKITGSLFEWLYYIKR